jgi:hypothetical protein
MYGPFWGFASDGAAVRRPGLMQIFEAPPPPVALMPPWLQNLAHLKLLDLSCDAMYMTNNFDERHVIKRLAKRCRSEMGVRVGEFVLTR